MCWVEKRTKGLQAVEAAYTKAQRYEKNMGAEEAVSDNEEL